MSKIQIYIDGKEVDIIPGTVGLSISYKLEEDESGSFQEKSSGAATSVVLPATNRTVELSNAYHNPSVEDLTDGQVFRNERAGLIVAGGYEILKGPAYLTEATYQFNVPLTSKFDFFGDNADFMSLLNNTTFYDLLKDIEFNFTVEQIMKSWAYDGRDENLPYVFAPVRYGEQMDDGYSNYVQQNPALIKDYSMAPEYMKPAFSPYWLIVWGFRSIGYRLDSKFLDTDYFRRLTMPWTWGNFLFSDGTQTQNLQFVAKSTGSRTIDSDFTGTLDLLLSNDNSNGGYDDNDVYTYDNSTKKGVWTYKNNYDYGTLDATFHLQINYDYVATDSGDVEARVKWFKNGVQLTTSKPNENGNGDLLFEYHAPRVGGNRDANLIDIRQTITVNPNDVISVQFYGHLNDTSFGTSHMTLQVLTFEIEYFRVPIGGTIRFTNYLSLKKYNFLDFLRGIIDAFNIIPKADSINRVLTFEPEHPYPLTGSNVMQKGYFNGNTQDWTGREDVYKESSMENFRNYNRNLVFKFKDDSNDGILKLIQDRYSLTLGQGKYVLPPRFANDTTEIENRFFSPVMHYNVMQWKDIGKLGDAPQMVCMIPENVSNTSREEAQNTFSPKLCWYKGEVEGYGWVFNKIKRDTYPFMFAVNYKNGGADDPILSYADEKLLKGAVYLLDGIGNYVLDSTGARIILDPGGYPVVGKGLLRRFYLQRMAIMRNGQYLTTNFSLNVSDVVSPLHREHIISQGVKWELLEIKDFNPETESSCECVLRKHAPIIQADSEAIYPSGKTVLGAPVVRKDDLKYYPLLALSSDIKLSE